MPSEVKTPVRYELSDNVHPNCDGSPWGWLVIAGTRTRVATYSGYDEKERCQQIADALNAYHPAPVDGDLVERAKAVVRSTNCFEKASILSVQHQQERVIADAMAAFVQQETLELTARVAELEGENAAMRVAIDAVYQTALARARALKTEVK